MLHQQSLSPTYENGEAPIIYAHGYMKKVCSYIGSLEFQKMTMRSILYPKRTLPDMLDLDWPLHIIINVSIWLLSDIVVDVVFKPFAELHNLPQIRNTNPHILLNGN